mgnify:CR=1 FL=1
MSVTPLRAVARVLYQLPVALPPLVLTNDSSSDPAWLPQRAVNL